MRRMLNVVGWACGLAAACIAVSPVLADEFVDRVNAQLVPTNIPQDKRSDLVILPLLAKMADPPEAFATQQKAALLPATNPEFAAAAEWAQGETQKPLFDALDKVTKEDDYRKAFVFAQPYGVDAVADQMELVQAGLYTELPDGLLIMAEFGYLDKLEKLGILVHVEATRLAADGKVEEALHLLREWVLFTRQFADRPFLKEKLWALGSMKLGVERIRDVVYQDFRAQSHVLGARFLTDYLKKMKLERSYFDLDRLEWPMGDRGAQDQLISRTIERGGDPDAAQFAAVLSKVDAQDSPLRRFSSAAYWDRLRGRHQGWDDTQQMSAGIFRDFAKRWSLSPKDPYLRTQSDYAKFVARGAPFAMLRLKMDHAEDLFDLRRTIRTEWAGLRAGLGVYAYDLQFRSLPPDAAAVSRDFLEGLGIPQDPYMTSVAALWYFVPQRDTPIKDKPYEMKIYPGGDMPNFTYPIGSDQYVIYSVGRDGRPQGASVVLQDQAGAPGDYLLWPPLISLVRQRLDEMGELH